MSSRACTYCGSNDIDYDPARGDAVCTNCGSVLEDKIIVSEVQFQESSSGAASVIGQYVSNDGSKGGMSMGSGFRQVSDKDSRAITLQKGKTKIRIVGEQLRLNQHCIDTAFNFFKIAVSKRLTRGRKTSHVVAACLYIVCRTEGTPHMLLDFSDLLQVNVYTLGRTYLTFSQELCINIPAIDPCLYIPRFAHKMEFGDKTHEVSMTALRLVQRMKRDWMHTGRRPSGLCGAALVVAARIHNFNRTLKDLIKIVRVCESTIRRRLTEFSDTPSSQLTIHEFEFQKVDLEQEQDPPCYTEGKKKAKLQHLEEPKKLSELTKEIDHIKEEIEKKLDAARPKCGPWAGYAKMNTDAPEMPASPVEGESNVISTLEEETLAEITKDILTDKDSAESTEECKGDPVDLLNIKSDIVKGPTPTAASLGIRECIQECLEEKPTENSKVEPPEEVDEELDLSGIDDDEIDKMLLTEEEIKLKTQVWMAANEEFLKEMKEKEEKRAKEIKPEKKKREFTRKQNQPQPATANEAITRLLMEKKISSKINYGVLNDLKNQSSDKDIDVPNTPVKLEPVIKTEPSFLNRFKRHHDLMNESKPKQKLSKKVKIEKKETEPEIVVESGPVQYVNDEKEEIENVVEDEDEEEEHISASQLLGHGVVDYAEEEVYDIDDDD